ncbi:hypothetical protein PoB_007630600 [Plakobranchus ocellatus]|uniref:Uncharacterized protein n=1 Tax=Plakobranchus ocellatus TaxID=259542 RepID=A0AAV4E113_9GAST|nr:hypothetical protein PoB_007630600 [Plakobranchus ocellatus]
MSLKCQRAEANLVDVDSSDSEADRLIIIGQVPSRYGRCYTIDAHASQGDLRFSVRPGRRWLVGLESVTDSSLANLRADTLSSMPPSTPVSQCVKSLNAARISHASSLPLTLPLGGSASINSSFLSRAIRQTSERI